MSSNRPISAASRRCLPLAGLLLAAALFAGCERVPDPCANYKLACLAVTVDSGPAAVSRMRVDVDDGLDSSTDLTPKKPPKDALVYPLRFAIRFGQFDQRYRGSVTFTLSGLNADFDTLGQVQTTVPLAEGEKKSVEIALGDVLPDLMAPPADGALPVPPDLGGGDQGAQSDLRP